MRHTAVSSRRGNRDYYEVGRESIRQFARAVQDFHPAHWDDGAARSRGYRGLIAPVTFASSTGTLAQRTELRDILAEFAPSRLLYVEQELRIHRPVTVGDRLYWDTSVDSVRPTDGGDLIVVRILIIYPDTGPFQTVHTTLLHTRAADAVTAAETVGMESVAVPAPRGPVTAAPAPRPASRPTSAPPALLPGQRLASRNYRLARGDLVNFAGISGDNNPIHWNDAVARAAGLADVAAHGMLTMGIGSSFLTSCFDNPCWTVEYTVQFSSPVYIAAHEPARLVIAGQVRSIDDRRGTSTVALTATAGGQPVFRRAVATIGITPDAELH